MLQNKVHYPQQVAREVEALCLRALTEKSQAHRAPSLFPPHGQIELNLIREDW